MRHASERKEPGLSPERFSTYLRLAGGSRIRALTLHEWNTCVNAALLRDFAHLQVGVRNRYNRPLLGADPSASVCP